MIKAIRMKNFRTHANTELELHEGVNVLLGESDSGKTNIIRALNWIAFNRPLGFRFHSDFAEDSDTDVCIDLQDEDVATTVSLRKNSSGAAYTVKDEGSKVTCKAVGKDVPDVVAQVLNLNDLNIQEQLDKPFLICETAPEVARILNQATQLERVDEMLQSMTSSINEMNRSIKADQISMDEKKKELEKFDSLDALEVLIHKAEKVATRIDKATIQGHSLAAALKMLREFDDKVKRFESLDALEKLLVRAEKIRDHLLQLKEDEVALKSLLVAATSQRDKLSGVTFEMGMMREKFTRYLRTVKECPYCKLCTEPIANHSFDDLIGEGENENTTTE